MVQSFGIHLPVTIETLFIEMVFRKLRLEVV